MEGSAIRANSRRHTSFTSNSLDLFVSKETIMYNLVFYCGGASHSTVQKPIFLCIYVNPTTVLMGATQRNTGILLYLMWWVYYFYHTFLSILYRIRNRASLVLQKVSILTALDCWCRCKSFISQWQSCAGIVVISILPGILSLFVLQWKW